jgi:3-isopropylmalate dehydrogenase
MAMLLTTKLMLDYLGEGGWTNRLEAAIARVIREGKVRTYVMGGTNSTLEVAEAVSGYV